MNPKSIVVVTLLVSSIGVICSADDWPQWRGIDRAGKWNESGVISEFTSDDLKPVWRESIGTGYSSPTVVDDALLLMDYDERKQEETIRCLNSKTGKLNWKHTYSAPYTISYTAGPRSSVTVDNGLAYALGAMGRLHCIDVVSGKIKWEKDLNKEYKIAELKRMPIWGIACSPLVFKDVLIIQIGAKDASVIGLDRNSGKEVWKALDDRAHYSSPVLVKQNEKDVVVCWTGDNVVGLDPVQGNIYWKHSFKPTRMPIGVATPIIKDDRIFMTSFYDGSMMLEMSKSEMTAKQLWHHAGENERSTKAIHSIISTPIWIDDHIYGVDSYGELRCISAADGSRVWEDLTAVKKARWGTIHFVSHGKDVWMFNEQGELMIGSLSPTGLDVKSRASVLQANQMRRPNRRNGVCWSHPAFANKCVYLRNDKELICISLAE